ncbi:MAG: hypothetical protein D6768_20810 [Chloroflexi bacterium]|nr:MAG: hypothetical protein D6768_20810 [Chloroflexota bacterium]
MDSIQHALETALGVLPREDLEVLKDTVVVSNHPAESIICHEGDVEYVLYIIQEGNVAFTKKMEHGDQLLGYKSTGEFFGELGVLDHAPRAATVHAISDCTLIEIHEDALDILLARNPSVSRAIMRGITRSMRDTDQITIAKLQFTNEELARANHELAQALEDLRAAQAELLRRERMKRDLEIATQVHKGILPVSFPDIPHFEFAAAARPAREIGGDLYDVININNEQVGLVMADASGKSVQAAIYMAIVKALILSQAQANLSTVEVAHRVHNLLMKVSTAEMFVTVFYANLNYRTRHMSYIRGGHDRPVFYQAASGTTRLLEPPGRFLGLLPNLIVEEDGLTFEPGDVLVCYSDGVTDAVRAADKSMYGLGRLRKIVAREHHRPAQELVDIIVDDVDRFRDGADQPDDLTLLVTKAV